MGPRPYTKTGQIHAASSPRLGAHTQSRRLPPCPRNHTNTPSHCHCNDSPGRNTNQLSSTITAQLIQMPVTTHPKRGHNPPYHTLYPLHATLQPAALIPPNASCPSPPVHEKERKKNQ
ncbi:hypothetical protein AMECASPLE_022463 [Ameca splendens]|uniref:Uncharacterized protein n=1 Tax=Ameca splendens TaxID=208324 RepID=A0ABV0Z247_9TELE